MDKDTLISYINSLGFNHVSVDDSGTLGDPSSTAFIFDEHLSVVLEETRVPLLEKKLDYYTSYYGNHPYTYNVKFIWFRQILGEYSLDTILPIDIVNSIDDMMEVYNQAGANTVGMNRWLQYERLKTPVLKSILRDLKLQIVFMDNKDKGE